VKEFISECINDAFSHTSTGKNIPIQTELLDKSAEDSAVEEDFAVSDGEMNDRDGVPD
jgi:hypothetical protein